MKTNDLIDVAEEQLQGADTLEWLLSFLVDPATKRRCHVQRSSGGKPVALRCGDAAYPITRGVPHLLVNEDTLVDAFGARNVETWLRLQAAAEASYAVRTEGHFSTEKFQPAIDYGNILQRLPVGTYLDVGCGLLPEPVYMQRARRIRFVGVDPMRLDALRPFPFVQAYGDFLPFHDGAFDGVLFSSSLDHMFNPFQAMQEAMRTLRTGGYLVVFETIRDDDEAFAQWRRKSLYFTTPYNRHHNWAFTADSISDLIQDAGAEIQFVEETCDQNEVVLVCVKPTADQPQQKQGVASEIRTVDDGRIQRRWQSFLFPEGSGHAARYAEKMHAKPYDFYAERARLMTVRGELMLDAGCGTGTWSCAFAPYFDQIDGIDKNEERVNLARWVINQLDLTNINIICGDVSCLPFYDQKYDFVFCYGVIISYVSIKATLGEFFRVLRPGGQLYVCLNGVGWSMYLRDVRSQEDVKYRIMGERGLYNTVCESLLTELPTVLSELGSDLVRPGTADETMMTGLTFSSSEVCAFVNALRSGDPKVMADIPLPAWAEPRDTSTESLDVAHAEGLLRAVAPLIAPHGQDLLEAGERIRHECGPAYVLTLASDVVAMVAGRRRTFSFNNAGRGYEPDEVEQVCREVGFESFRWAGESRLFAPRDRDLALFDSTYCSANMVWEFVARRPTS